MVQTPVTERIALVLGAGGAYGWVFHAGVLHGIERAMKTHPNDAELIIGTSAGSAIGAAIRAGIEPQGLAEVVARPPTEDDRARMRTELRDARKSLAPFAPRLVQHARNQDRAGMLGIAGLLPAGIFPTAWLARFPGADSSVQAGDHRLVIRTGVTAIGRGGQADSPRHPPGKALPGKGDAQPGQEPADVRTIGHPAGATHEEGQQVVENQVHPKHQPRRQQQQILEAQLCCSSKLPHMPGRRPTNPSTSWSDP